MGAPAFGKRYSAAELHGKGFLKLSYQVESQYTTRRFKNHLKHLGIFSPKYRKSDREQLFFERTVKLYSLDCSNRAFKRKWLREKGTIRGLKLQPKVERREQPLHVGTYHHSKGKFYPDPLLGRKHRLAVWIKRLVRFVAKVPGENQKREEPGNNGPGQPPANPAGPARAGKSVDRLVVVTSSGVDRALGGQAFPSRRDLFRRFPDGTFRFFTLVNGVPTYGGTARSA